MKRGEAWGVFYKEVSTSLDVLLGTSYPVGWGEGCREWPAGSETQEGNRRR